MREAQDLCQSTRVLYINIVVLYFSLRKYGLYVTYGYNVNDFFCSSSRIRHASGIVATQTRIRNLVYFLNGAFFIKKGFCP